MTDKITDTQKGEDIKQTIPLKETGESKRKSKSPTDENHRQVRLTSGRHWTVGKKRGKSCGSEARGASFSREV